MMRARTPPPMYMCFPPRVVCRRVIPTAKSPSNVSSPTRARVLRGTGAGIAVAVSEVRERAAGLAALGLAARIDLELHDTGGDACSHLHVFDQALAPAS
jgi:hypothetical protein